MSDYVLRVEGINKSFRQQQVVRDISFEVKKGEILGLLGPNGAGKTTVIRMIMGIFQPDSGRIHFDRDYIIDRKKVGYLPEERGTYDETRVLETIVYFARLKGLNKAEAEERAMFWLEKMGLKDNARNKMEELSKGMQQKVQFIISVIHKPTLLVLDEVFSGLDPVNQNLFKDLIWVLAGSLIISYFDLKMLEILYSFKSLLIVLYVFFAFLLVASLNAIVGASMKDAQSGSQTAGFLILIPLIPIYFTSSILQNPNGTISKVLSYIPFFSPTTMMLRLGVSTPPGREIILTLAILLVFSYLLILLSAKLFRIGMLMYGKNVNLRELIKWARSKDY